MKVLTHFILWQLGLAGPQTQTTEAERRCLAEHARGKKIAVEIGVWHGLTTAMLKSVLAPEGLLVAVDPFPPGRLGVSFPKRIAHGHLKQTRNAAILWLEKPSQEAVAEYQSRIGKPVEFVFIDGDHSYEAVRMDWQAWSPLVAAGGIIALHDSVVREPASPPGSAVFTQLCILPDPAFQCVRQIDSLTVLRKKNYRSLHE